MSKITNLQPALTVHQRLAKLEADNEHLRQRADQAQEANYLLEGDLADAKQTLVNIKYKQACDKFRKPILGEQYKTLDQYLASFGDNVDRMVRAVANWDKLANKIMGVETND